MIYNISYGGGEGEEGGEEGGGGENLPYVWEHRSLAPSEQNDKALSGWITEIVLDRFEGDDRDQLRLLKRRIF